MPEHLHLIRRGMRPRRPRPSCGGCANRRKTARILASGRAGCSNPGGPRALGPGPSSCLCASRRTPIMQPRRTLAAVGLVWLALAMPGPAPGDEPAAPRKTPLDEYIAKPDPTYSWKLVQTIPGDGYTTFVVDLKSQSWRS